MAKKSERFCLVFSAMIVCALICSSCMSSSGAGKVEIITSEDEGITVPAPKADFVSKIKDVLVFSLRSDAIDRRGSLGFAKARLSMLENGSYPSVVNILFVNISGERRKLFESDRLIAGWAFCSHQQASVKSSSYSLGKNLYIVVDEDTNDDGSLSEDDQRNLYASDYDGANLKLIMEDISSYRMIDDNEVLISQDNGETEDFYFYNVETDELVKLNTQV
ncbi:MAG: hypothetical protein JXR23_02455 [Pontiellaceae bacterium]|nr:hypothetical protein [Pontiellaceae bacterium]